MQYIYIAALKGSRVLAPDALGFGERRTGWGYSSHFADEINLQNELTSRGRSLAWKSVWDNSRGIEVLEALGSETIGTIGWSGESTQTYILAAANRKVKAAACLFSFLTLRHQFYQFRLYHCFYHFIPGMMQAGLDWDQVVSLIPPRKIFMARGENDKGLPENNHEITMEMLEAALVFLGNSL